MALNHLLIKPPVVPQLPFGLFSVFEPQQQDDGHWQGGVEYESLNCEGVFHTAAEACAAPVGTNEVQTVTITGAPTGGTYRLTIFGQTTAPIAYNASNATVQTALEALDVFEPGDVVVTGTATSRVLTFDGRFAATDLPQIEATDVALTGGTAPAITTGTTTEGVRTGKTIDPFGAGTVSFDPFTIYAARSCSGPTDYARAADRAMKAFAVAEQRAVESSLWARWTDAAAGVDIIPGAGLTPVEALAAAEQWAAENYGGSAVFHARRALVTHLSVDLTERHGKRLETKQGTPIVSGAGYGTEGPNGTAAAPGVEWIIVTGQGRAQRSTAIARGPFLVQSPLDNTHFAIVERTYVVDTDCLLGAVAITLP